jgi:hypothetical protein
MARDDARKGQVTNQETSQVKVAPRARRKRVRPAIVLTDSQRSRLCLETLSSLSTITRWADGYDVERTTLERLERAMEKCGFERVDRPLARRRRRRVAEDRHVA